jgi:hypothetical protein
MESDNMKGILNYNFTYLQVTGKLPESIDEVGMDELMIFRKGTEVEIIKVLEGVPEFVTGTAYVVLHPVTNESMTLDSNFVDLIEEKKPVKLLLCHTTLYSVGEDVPSVIKGRAYEINDENEYYYEIIDETDAFHTFSKHGAYSNSGATYKTWFKLIEGEVV